MMIGFTRLFGLAWKFLVRHRLRTILTILGVMSCLFLFTAVETMQRSLARATRIEANDTTLVVFRQNRFCPSTSRLPESHGDEIRKIAGVREAVPVQVVVNNCGASLDVVAFRGVPPEQLSRYAPEISITAGSLADWLKRDDGALVGTQLAARRGLKPGDRFTAAGIAVTVCGILTSPLPQDNDVAYVHLPFLQLASKSGLGIVTQFNVRVDNVARLGEVAGQIDALFKRDACPTETHPEKAFFARTASEMMALIGFTRWLGLGAVAAVIGLIANAQLLVVRGRVRENAILRTLGYPDSAIALLVLAEGTMLGFLGGLPGVVIASAFFHWRKLAIGNEGQVLAIHPDLSVIFTGLALAVFLGFVSSLWPAWQAMRQSITRSLNS